MGKPGGNSGDSPLDRNLPCHQTGDDPRGHRSLRYHEIDALHRGCKVCNRDKGVLSSLAHCHQRKIWQQLPPAQQKVLVDSANEAGKEYSRATYAAAENDMDAMMKDNNAVFMKVNLEPFAKKMMPFYQKLVQEGYLKKDIFDAVQTMR